MAAQLAGGAPAPENAHDESEDDSAIYSGESIAAEAPGSTTADAGGSPVEPESAGTGTGTSTQRFGDTLIKDITSMNEQRWYENIEGFEAADGAFATILHSSDALIAITGALPPFLIHFDPYELVFKNDGYDDWPFLKDTNWELLYTIPSNDIPALITQLENREDVSIAHNPNPNPGSEHFTFVVFSSRG